MSGDNGHRWVLPAADTYFAPRLTDEGFEIEKLKAALKHVKQFRCAVDGGAHIGTWTRELARHFVRVIAFEPAFDSYTCLIANCGKLANVDFPCAALGDTYGRGAMRDDATRPGNTGARYLGPGEEVGIVPLDEFELRDLDFLKLDLEGYELHALIGAAHTLRSCRPVVLIEEKYFGGRYGVKEGAALRLLESWGAREVERLKNDRVYSWN